MDINDFAEEFISNLRTDASISGTDTADEFYQQAIDTLSENGEFDDPTLFYFGKAGRKGRFMQIDGYCFDETDKSLSLLIFDFEDTKTPDTLVNSQIETLYKRLNNFLDEVCFGDLSDYCDASDDTLKLARLIKSRVMANEESPDRTLKIKYYIISNKRLSTKVKKIKQGFFDERPVDLNVWYLERFFELSQESQNETVLIDFENDFHCDGIPCIEGKIGENLGYSAYIAIIPGKLLADIYIEYGSKVLEGNVRAFLGVGQAKSVNAVIKRTIISEPSRFFTYNNGIATTAATIETKIMNGQLYITKIEDLQIINGGQTTASLAEAVLKKYNTELEGIYVPMKLTVINDRETIDDSGAKFYDVMVERIARYANSQNKVQASAFFSNSPYHILMEQMSKKYFAPPVNGNPTPTGWYYERTQKKYIQEQIKMTKAEKDRFEAKYPKKQIIHKEDLGKYLYCIEEKPYIVARGKTKIMNAWGAEINEAYKKNPESFNEMYFKKCVAAAILFKTVDSYLEKLKRIPGAWYQVGGYKLDIVPYTISKICHSIPSGYEIDWMGIWKNQKLSNGLMKEIEIVTKMTNDFICDSHGVIVTEYCKREDTWTEYAKIPHSINDDLMLELIRSDYVQAEKKSAAKAQKSDNYLKDALMLSQLGTEYWKQLINKGYNAKLLNYKEMTILKVMVDVETTGKMPSEKQTKEIIKIQKRLEDSGIIV